MFHATSRPKILCLMLFFFLGVNLYATHNRAGEITYEQLGDLTIRVTVTTYTKASSTSADRDTIELNWGDGALQWLARANGTDGDNNGYLDGELLENDIKKNLYIATHTYAGPSHYVLSMQDPNRNAGVLNVNAPNSQEVEFFIQTTVTLFSGQFQGYNNSPVLLQPPVDVGCVGKRFVHNPNAYDIDGDSLAYKLIVPLRDVNVNVPNYQFPNQISPDPSNLIDLNEITGDFIWQTPQQAGEYNIAMQIIEYRNGTAIDTLIRDMQILIKDCENEPPIIETVAEICVVAGETIDFDVIVTDPDKNPLQLVQVSALGGPFEVKTSPAVFLPDTVTYEAHPLVGTFTWNTTCEHISDQYYSVVFKAVDNFFGTTGLATLKTVRIKVVGPPPEDVQALPDTDLITITWEQPYDCEAVMDDYFRGFSVWRRDGSNNFPIDDCEPGLAGKGYTQIGFDTQDSDNGRYIFLDMDVERGRTYCYRILGEFSLLTPAGYSYNRVKSLPSDEICVQLNRDIPLITNVDVQVTDMASGEIEVRWTKPSISDLDTVLNAGPYTYELLRATGLTPGNYQAVPGASFTSPTFEEANDTTFIDTGLNTVENPYSYQVAFYVNGEAEPLGITSNASSVFLTVSPTDESNQLSWADDVPWDNYEYVIYRKEPNGTSFDSLTTLNEMMYLDENLINGEEYCYYIQSVGSYAIEGVVAPLINRSQEVCARPIDNVPPCPPPLTVVNICDETNNTAILENFINTLSWFKPESICENSDDVAGYNIYYTPQEGTDLELIDQILFAEDTIYLHEPDLGLVGCYAVTAVDSIGNESAFSNIVCKDNCPTYELPNVFTPNGDGANELYIPFPYRFIAAIDIKIYNSWGTLVYETRDPDINWDGKNLRGQEVAEGVYYYKCTVFEQRVSGVAEAAGVLSGFIELIR